MSGGDPRTHPSGGMTSPTAEVLIVFGRGVTCTGDGWALTPAGAARVRAVVDHVTASPAGSLRPRVVFSGGWAEACEGAEPPPAGSREGDLMRHAARAAGLDRCADLRVENRSRSTLENLLHTAEDGLLDGYEFSARHPLGIVSHAWHLPRVRFLAGRVLGLRGVDLLDVPATGGELSSLWRPAQAVHLAARLGFLGARGSAGMLRRERAMVASIRRLERLTRGVTT